jgi:hypothetical protein
VGCSTKVIYTRFGNKDGLLAALWPEGFARFGRALGAVSPGPDPMVHLAALGRAYRDYAMAEPDYYQVMFRGVMFQGVIPGFVPDAEARRAARATLQIRTDAVAAAMDAGRLGKADPREIDEAIWPAAHGAVGLEPAGLLEPQEAIGRFRLVTSALVGALDTALGIALDAAS